MSIPAFIWLQKQWMNYPNDHRDAGEGNFNTLSKWLGCSLPQNVPPLLHYAQLCFWEWSLSAAKWPPVKTYLALQKHGWILVLQEYHNGLKHERKTVLVYVLTVITPVAAVTPASPNKAVAASVTKAVAAMFATLQKQKHSATGQDIQLQWKTSNIYLVFEALRTLFRLELWSETVSHPSSASERRLFLFLSQLTHEPTSKQTQVIQNHTVDWSILTGKCFVMLISFNQTRNSRKHSSAI